MKFIFLITAFLISFNVSKLHASIITPNFFFEANHINIINGLAWLDLDQTSGLSVNNALIENPSYRIATKNEFHKMFQLFGNGSDQKFLGNDLVNLNYINYSAGYTQYSGDLLDYNINTIDSFMAVFGITSQHSNAGGFFKTSYGIYDTGNGNLARGGTQIALHKHTFDSYYELYDGASNKQNSEYFFNNASSLGTFLVKDILEPSIISLMGIGLFSLAFARKRIKK